MKLVVKHKSSQGQGHYKTKDLAFWCSDARLTRLDEPEKSLLIKSVQVLGLKMPDVVIVAGGAMGLRDPNSQGFQYLLGQALSLWELHGIETFRAVIHINCGAYKKAGLLKEGDNERKFSFKEALTIRANLEQGLRKNKCDSRVIGYLADFDNGLWEV